MTKSVGKDISSWLSKKLAGFPFTLTKTKEIAKHVFPIHTKARYIKCTAEELHEYGIGDITPEIITEVAAGNWEYVLKIYPSWFFYLNKIRLLCLLNVHGKLYKNLRFARLQQELISTADLSQ